MLPESLSAPADANPRRCRFRYGSLVADMLVWTPPDGWPPECWAVEVAFEEPDPSRGGWFRRVQP